DKQLSGIRLPIRRSLPDFSPSARAPIVDRRVAVEGHMPNETPRLSLTEVHQEAIKAANNSWTETDKLYVSVCSPIIALVAIFGRDRDKPDSTTWMAIASLLLIALAINWWILTARYRCKIRISLKELSVGKECSDVKDHFVREYERFSDDK